MSSQNEMKYPALYESANIGSSNSQISFLNLVRAEITLLIILSIYSALKKDFNWPNSLQVIILVILVILLLVKFFQKYDQKWYQCRALAESVKTASWRYVMRAHPFDDDGHLKVPQANFRKFLNSILSANNSLGNVLSSKKITNEQLPDGMNKIRDLNIGGRLDFYIKHRVDEQRAWYASKAEQNQIAVKVVACIAFGVYVLAIFSVLSGDVNMPILAFASDPLLVIATSLIGWMQLKKYSELSASYALTANEIGILKTKIHEVHSEAELSEFVNEAETAFSREHTQWAARKDAA